MLKFLGWGEFFIVGNILSTVNIQHACCHPLNVSTVFQSLRPKIPPQIPRALLGDVAVLQMVPLCQTIPLKKALSNHVQLNSVSYSHIQPLIQSSLQFRSCHLSPRLLLQQPWFLSTHSILTVNFMIKQIVTAHRLPTSPFLKTNQYHSTLLKF